MKLLKTLTFRLLLARYRIPCPCHAERHLNVKKWYKTVNFKHLGNELRATTVCTFSTCQLPKVVLEWCALHILTWKCASRHNGMYFFDITPSKSALTLVCFYISTWKRASRHNGVHVFDMSTSKKGPSMVCFVHFNLEMCFAPQRCAIFHLSSDHMAPHPPL